MFYAPPIPLLFLNIYIDRHSLSICLKEFMHTSCHSSHPSQSYSSPMALGLNYCVVHFPVTRGLVNRVIDWFSCRQMDLPLVSPPKSTSVWADCHCFRDRISPGDHPPCKHPSPRPRMVINGVRLSHNKSN